jgi:hypothetical protein
MKAILNTSRDTFPSGGCLQRVNFPSGEPVTMLLCNYEEYVGEMCQSDDIHEEHQPIVAFFLQYIVN